jgi:hypothetical protein
VEDHVGIVRSVALDGLTVAAAVAGDRNLGMREMGGEEPTAVKAIITVDPRATPAQRDALVRFVRAMSRGLITQVVRVDTAPIKFATSQNYVEVSVPESMQLTVNKEMGTPELRRECNGSSRSRRSNSPRWVSRGYSFSGQVSEPNGPLRQSVQHFWNVLFLVAFASVLGAQPKVSARGKAAGRSRAGDRSRSCNRVA